MPTRPDPIPDLVRGLRTAARTLELIDTIPQQRQRDRDEMLSDVWRDLSRLSYLLLAARAESRVA